jgi:hypothetical protein
MLNKTTDANTQRMNERWGRHGRDHMVVGFTTTDVMCAYHH